MAEHAETQPDARLLDVAARPIHWGIQLGWLLAAAYLVGVASRKSREAFWGYPSMGNSDLVDANNAIYGGLILALVGISILGYLAIDVRRPYAEARNWWENEQVRRGANNVLRGSAFGALMVTRRWITTVLLYILPYYIALGLLALTASGGAIRVAVRLFLFLSVFSLSSWRQGHLETTGKAPAEKHFAAPHLAAILSISRADRPAFSRTYSLLLIALITGVWFYPEISASVGGGRPIRVIVTLQNPRESNGRVDAASAGDDTLYFAGERGDYVAFRFQPDDPNSVRFVPKRSISEMRLLREPK